MAERPDRPEEPTAPTHGAPRSLQGPLLGVVARQALDEDYRTAATRRIVAGGTPGRGGRHTIAAAAVLLFGLLIATAAVQTSQNAEVDAASRSTLLARIDDRSALVAEQQARVAQLRARNEELGDRYSGLGSELQAAENRVTQLQTAAGYVAVQGPGVRFHIDDSPDGSSEGRVRAGDLRLLVNGLWQAGAEAVSLNDHRIGTRSTISTSGGAIQIDGSPLPRPYRVEAIGDRQRLLADFFQTTTGVLFQAYSQQFGFTAEWENVETLRLGAAPTRQTSLTHAEAKDARSNQGDQEEGSP